MLPLESANDTIVASSAAIGELPTSTYLRLMAQRCRVSQVN